MTFVPPAVFMRALELKGTLASQPPHFTPSYNDDYDYVGLLGLGHKLGLWKFMVTKAAAPAQDGQPARPKIYVVEMNDRVLELLEPEVPGWVLGVLHTTGLEIGPFAYREGL